MNLRVYLDTSVFSAYFDARLNDRQAQTEEFWLRLDQFDASTSELAVEEIDQTPDPERRTAIQKLAADVIVHPVTDEMKTPAKHYVTSSIFAPSLLNDAIHVAAAVLTRQDILVSWNFKHLVNRRRRAMVNEANTAMGLPSIEIVAPPEI